MMHSRFSQLLLLLTLALLLASDPLRTFAQQGAASGAIVPPLVNFSGVLTDLNGEPPNDVVGVTFALYREQEGGAPLWLETQNVTTDKAGNYSVTLGSTTSTGLPAEIFAAGQAHWLGIQPAGQAEQPRVLLLSVPYALKAGDAQTLGGLPLSAFVLAPTAASSAAIAGASVSASGVASSQAAGASKSQGNANPATTCNVTSNGSAATNALSKFSSPCVVAASAVSESGGNLGIGIAPSNATQLYVVDTQSNFGTKWLQRSIFNTSATANGTNYALALDADASSMTIPAGVTDNGYRLGAFGRGFADTTGFAGTLAQQFGVNGSAGILLSKSGATVGSAYGGYYQIYNRVAGTTITNAYGLYVSNSDTTGTITNRYDLYASSPNATSYFAGTVGIGTTAPAALLDAEAPGVTSGSGSAVLRGVGGTATGDGIGGGPGVVGYGGGGTGQEAYSDGPGGYFVGGDNAYSGDGVDAFAGSGYAGYFTGNVGATGSISGSLDGIRIDHPLDPANKYLVHASVESSEMLNFYAGNIATNSDGEARVQLPGWFEALNTDFRYQLTVIGQFAQAIVWQKIQNNTFTIRTSAPNVEVSWQVTGVRKDAYAHVHPLVVEEEKDLPVRGFYLHPELYGAPQEKQIEWARHPELMRMKQKQKVTNAVKTAATRPAP